MWLDESFADPIGGMANLKGMQSRASVTVLQTSIHIERALFLKEEGDLHPQNQRVHPYMQPLVYEIAIYTLKANLHT